MQLLKQIDEMLPWNDREQLLECISAVEEAPSVMTFSFRTEEGNWFRYDPGQFVTLELPATDQAGNSPVLRTFTISSTPSRPFTISVTVKAQKDSIGARWMLDHLRPGVKIRAFGPAGQFSIANVESNKYLFISAGSGITPMMSMTRCLFDRAPHSDVAFINCARSPNDIIFRKELDYMATRMEKMRLAFIVEQSSQHEAWHGLIGRLGVPQLEVLVPDFRERTIFCCGPDPFMRIVKAFLQIGRFDMSRYHQESFAPFAEEAAAAQSAAQAAPAKSPAAKPAPVADAATATVKFSLSGVEVNCGESETILKVARNNGLKIPSACEFGLCGTCKVKCLQGEVEMNHNGGIRDDEIAEGYILACCSRPRGLVEIDA